MDTLTVGSLKMSEFTLEGIYKTLNDTISLGEIFNDLIDKCLIIKDPEIIASLVNDKNWISNHYIGVRQHDIKVGQFYVENEYNYFYLFDGKLLIRIPFNQVEISDLKSIQITPLDDPPINAMSGTIYYDNKTKRLKYFNGTKWKKL